MTVDEPLSAIQIAGAVLDGTPIDWSLAESTADEASLPLLAQLRVLATLADLHRHVTVRAADAAPASVDPGEEPETWGHLRVLERVGDGAHGAVYRAWDTRLDREVALKLLPSDDSTQDDPASSIIREARLLARVRHPNVVTIYGAERIGRRNGLWMEFIRGRTLKQIVDDGKVFSGAEAAAMGADLCRAVAAVHGAGLLHRDIKAQNVMRADDGRTVLMDFGTGRELSDVAASDLAGTPLYLAPEVLAGGEATVQSDLYSLGVLLYHLVTGSYPVRAASVQGIRQAHERNERTGSSTSQELSTLPRRLAQIIERTIDPQPERRYRSADALAAELAALAPHPARAARTYAMPVLGALILVLAVWWGVFHPVRTTIASRGEEPAIAVLPFKNLSVEPESDYFVDGLTDEVIRNLAVIQGLQVRSSTSAFAFKDRPRNLRQVGDELGVNFVVEGSVLRAGDKLRVNVQLVEVAKDTPLWSDQFDRELKDVFAIQDDISRAIVNKLRLTLGRGQRRYDTDVTTYELYLKGRALVDLRGIPNLDKAAELFTQVLARDPAFAPAQAGLANAYALMSAPVSSSMSYEAAHSIIRPAALKARELDPLLADAQAAMGWMYSRERDWANADNAFRRAIELNPSLTQTYTSYSNSTLRPLGRLDEALRILHVALQRDPLSLDVQREIGEVQFVAGRYEDAINTLQRVAAIEPDFPFVRTFLGRAMISAGRPMEALTLLEALDGRNLGRLKPQARRAPWLARAYIMTGRRADAETLVGDQRDSPSGLAIIYAALGDKDRTFEELDQLAVVQPHHVASILENPEMAVLHGDPRLAALRERFGLPAQ